HKTAILEQEVSNGRTYNRPIKMLPFEVEGIDIVGEKDPTSIDDREGMMVSPIRMEDVLEMPSVAPSIEALMKSMPGVATNNEFSSQYQVRGGNFDENLVYVNGIEIYRPFLARSGQQEGLGFSNPSMAQGLKFSTGGFGAQYGDKLSSVLDITYRTPKSFRATVEAGIITTNLHFEGISKNKKEPKKPGKFTYLMGARRFAMAYLLNSLETRGDYQPSFMDYQGMFTYTPKNRYRPEKIRQKANGKRDTLYYVNEPIKFTSFVAVTRNRFQFIPTERTTTTGTIQQAFRLATLFQGRELSAYTTGLGAVMMEHQPHSRLKFDYTLTAFRTQESELFDIEGYYLLGEVNTNFGSSEFNETEFDLGVGSQFRSGRNYLRANVFSAKMRGFWTTNNSGNHRFLFGAKVQRQMILDNLREYEALDSAGYLVDSTGRFGLEEVIRAQNQINSQLYSAYLQHEWRLNQRVSFHYGARAVYYDLINRWMISPRGQLLIKLKESRDGETQARLRFAGGMYQQPPFYREMRRFDGSLNLNVKPQSSAHLITGLDYRFFAWNRPFRLFVEGYYKRLYNLIPYEIENIRLRYYPDKTADGYAYGIDLRLNGEFIKGVDSWVSMGLLKTEEDVLGDEIGYVPRPTDQRFTFAMYFQDELPINPTYKVHISYIYGSGMRFGPPRTFDLRTS
ncbi:MAG: TonB-dependent receptor plug domain-containing protein, partial [Bacteroidota bacterium]